MNADESACHTTTDEIPSVSRPWADDPRSDAKDTLLEYALRWPEGTPVVRAVRDEAGLGSEVGSAEHRLALRFYDEDYPHLFETARLDGHVWVWPRDVATLLKE